MINAKKRTSKISRLGTFNILRVLYGAAFYRTVAPLCWHFTKTLFTVARDQSMVSVFSVASLYGKRLHTPYSTLTVLRWGCSVVFRGHHGEIGSRCSRSKFQSWLEGAILYRNNIPVRVHACVNVHVHVHVCPCVCPWGCPCVCPCPCLCPCPCKCPCLWPSPS
jgi:hypothetical protein